MCTVYIRGRRCSSQFRVLAVEVERVLHCFAGVSVSEVFDGGGRVGDWISRAKKASEFVEEELGVLEPCCGSVDEISLESIKRRTLQVRQDERDFCLFIWEVGGMEDDVQ